MNIHVQGIFFFVNGSFHLFDINTQEFDAGYVLIACLILWENYLFSSVAVPFYIPASYV